MKTFWGFEEGTISNMGFYNPCDYYAQTFTGLKGEHLNAVECLSVDSFNIIDLRRSDRQNVSRPFHFG